MMTRLQLLLGKLAEECNEAAQRALKAQQFGVDEIQDGQSLNNKERLNMELNDIYAVVEMLNDELRTVAFPKPLKGDLRMIEGKILKVEKYYNLSKEKGQVQ